MKKLLFSVLATLCVALGAFTLTSCGGDDDNGTSSSKVVEIQYGIVVSPSADMLKYCDLELVYQGSDGNDVRKITEENETVGITFKTFPVTGTLKYTCKLKSGVTIPEDGTYMGSLGIKTVYVTLFSNGNTVSASWDISTGTKTLKSGSAFSEWIAQNATLGERKISFDKDGNKK